MENNNNDQYLLAALIEIYRGNNVPLPETNAQRERELLLDIYSAAISYARFDESHRVLSEDIFRCGNEGATVKEEADRARLQTPDVLNAKMVAAAHVMKILEGGRYRLS
ncbi:MAG: hypothetical protein ACYDEQ_09385 [Desulfocucumaceae bacterium]